MLVGLLDGWVYEVCEGWMKLILLPGVVSVINLIFLFRRRYGYILLKRVARWWVTMRWSSSISFISYRVSRWACPPVRTNIIYIYNRPRTASPAAMTTIIDEAPIDLRFIYADRDMKIMQANQRSSYINTAVCCIVIDLRPDAKSAKTLLANITSLATDCCR